VRHREQAQGLEPRGLVAGLLRGGEFQARIDDRLLRVARGLLLEGARVRQRPVATKGRGCQERGGKCQGSEAEQVTPWP